MLEQLSSANFEPLLHQTFQLRAQPSADQPALSLELIEVLAYGQRGAPTPAARAPFSLTFLEPGPAYLPQQIYTLAHPALGQLELFLVPIGADARGVRYQAVFG
jgi:hypothetical protein